MYIFIILKNKHVLLINMKVLYLHQYFTTPAFSGGTRSYEFAQQLLKRGHEVTIVTGASRDYKLPDTEIKNVRRGEVDGIDVIQLKVSYSNKMSMKQKFMAFMNFAFGCIRAIKREDFDLLFATSTPLSVGIPGIWMKAFSRKRKIPYIFEVRDLWPDSLIGEGLTNPIILLGMYTLERWCYKSADGCIGLSPGMRDGIRKRSTPDKPIIMVPNGSDLDLFHPKKKQKFQLDGVDSNDIVAIFTGAHGLANGLDAVLDMASILIQKGRQDIKMVFIGDGAMKPHLVKRAVEEKLTNCLFFDPIPKIELAGIVSSADIGLMVLKNNPEHRYGSSPNKYFDYIASGLPIVNNYPGWVADMVEKENLGIVVEPDNPKQFAETLIYLADHPELRSEQGKNARTFAERNFSRIDLANSFVDFLEKIYHDKYEI